MKIIERNKGVRGIEHERKARKLDKPPKKS